MGMGIKTGPGLVFQTNWLQPDHYQQLRALSIGMATEMSATNGVNYTPMAAYELYVASGVTHSSESN